VSVSPERFEEWLADVVAATSHLVVNVRKVGRRAENTFYVGRRMSGDGPLEGSLGNPFTVREWGQIGSIRKYVNRISRMSHATRISYLRPVYEALSQDMKLACWCAPEPCHAHILAAWVAQIPPFDWAIPAPVVAPVVASSPPKAAAAGVESGASPAFATASTR
jgi:hypothetical protein